MRNAAITEQYTDWIKAAVHGDFGISFKYKQPVMTVISGRLFNTLLLGGLGFVLTFWLALLTGSWWIILIPGVFLIVTLLCVTAIGTLHQRKQEQFPRESIKDENRWKSRRFSFVDVYISNRGGV